MKRDPMLYGVIGVLIGAVIVWFLASNVVNNQNTGMMRIMGMGTQSGMGGAMMGAGLDRTFIEQMIPHHEDAITMADSALQKAEHPEIKQLAQDITRTQSEEIKQMQEWYNSWYSTDVPQRNGQRTAGAMMGQMHGGMMGDDTDIKSLENAPNFDKAFIEEMIPHHQMAVMMANMLLQGTSRPEMKGLAQNIIEAQTKEINEMRQWYKDWGY